MPTFCRQPLCRPRPSPAPPTRGGSSMVRPDEYGDRDADAVGLGQGAGWGGHRLIQEGRRSTPRPAWTGRVRRGGNASVFVITNTWQLGFEAIAVWVETERPLSGCRQDIPRECNRKHEQKHGPVPSDRYGRDVFGRSGIRAYTERVRTFW